MTTQNKKITWLKGRFCINCGSSMVAWRFREPHCFNCGSNVPFSKRILQDIQQESHLIPNNIATNQDNPELIEKDFDILADKLVNIAHDFMLSVALAIISAKKAKKLAKRAMRRRANGR